VVIIHKVILAKFGCIIDKKVEKKTVSFYILGYLLEIFIRVWQFGMFFSIREDSDFPLSGVWASPSHLSQSGVATHMNNKTKNKTRKEKNEEDECHTY
jgi:hypothetical protein